MKMKNEKSETRFIFLNRYNNSRDILKISLETSGSKIVSANEVDTKKFQRGFLRQKSVAMVLILLPWWPQVRGHY